MSFVELFVDRAFLREHVAHKARLNSFIISEKVFAYVCVEVSNYAHG